MPRTPEGYKPRFLIDMDLSSMATHHRKSAILGMLGAVARDIERTLGRTGDIDVQEHAITERGTPIGKWQVAEVLDLEFVAVNTPPEPDPDKVEVGDLVTDGKVQYVVLGLHEEHVSKTGFVMRHLQTIAWLRGTNFGGMKFADVDLLSIIQKWKA